MHTPGPWKIILQCNAQYRIVSPAGDAELGTWTVAECVRGKTNAQLIEAAPMLLEALELATKELNAIRARDGAPQHIDWDRGRPIQTDSCTHEWWNELTEKCFAAVAAAKGGK